MYLWNLAFLVCPKGEKKNLWLQQQTAYLSLHLPIDCVWLFVWGPFGLLEQL